MKGRMKKAKVLGKVSSFLCSLKRKHRNYSDTRRSIRRNTEFPNSSKVGAGAVTARRRLPNLVLHKRNHRSNEIIGYSID